MVLSSIFEHHEDARDFSKLEFHEKKTKVIVLGLQPNWVETIVVKLQTDTVPFQCLSTEKTRDHMLHNHFFIRFRNIVSHTAMNTHVLDQPTSIFQAFKSVCRKDLAITTYVSKFLHNFCDLGFITCRNKSSRFQECVDYKIF